jgi:hypothetical protein
VRWWASTFVSAKHKDKEAQLELLQSEAGYKLFRPFSAPIAQFFFNS